MSDFQEQAKNWLRNVVKQNPDKIKAGVEKAGDLIDKQTGGKYADKVDAAQEKVGTYVDSQSASDDAPQSQPEEPAATEQSSAGEGAGASQSASDDTGAVSLSSGPEAETGIGDGAPDAADQAGSSSQADATSQAGAPDDSPESDTPEAEAGGVPAASGRVVGGETPDPSSEPIRSAGSRTEGARPGGTVTGVGEGNHVPPRESEGELPGPRD